MNRLIDVQGYGIAAVELNGNRYLALEISGPRRSVSKQWIPRAYGGPPTQSGGSAPAEKPHLPAGYKRRDEVVLTNKQAAWVIEDIETKESVYLKGAAPR